MAKSDYTYIVTSHRAHSIIVIVDLNKGRMSVTNDIQNVVEEIAIKEKIFLPGPWIIVYKDSEGIWDAYDCKSDVINILNAKEWKEAVDRYLELSKKSN